jgi:hypothetical protein
MVKSAMQKPDELAENQLQCYYVYHEYDMKSPRTEPGASW